MPVIARLLLLAALFGAALPTQAAHAVEPDGSLIRSAANNNWTYRVVGGAAIRITDCAPFKDCEGRKDVPSLAGYTTYPRDGAIIHNLADGGTYRFAGGAPLWISSCSYAPTCSGRTVLNSLADTAHIRAMPADGTVVRNVNDGGHYRFVGGAPLFVRCDMGAGCPATVNIIDSRTMSALGTNTPATPRMRQYPADGAVVFNGDDNQNFRFAGGAPLPVAAPASGAKYVIDSRTLVQQGTATAALPHMRPQPADNTFLNAVGTLYRVAGGAAVKLTNCSVLSNCPGAVAVDPGTISSAGLGRLLQVPKDGTVLRGLPSNTLWEIIGGQRRQTFVNVAGVSVDDGAIGLIPTPSTPTPAPVVITPPPKFAPVITSGYKVFRTYTRFTSLKVRDALPGAVVTVSCKGKGCPFKRQKYHRLNGTSLDVRSRWFKKAKLRSRATVLVRVSSPAGDRKQMEFKIRSRKLPVRTTRCSAAGAKLSRCA
ncbi:hypothetical protein DVA67_010720 [Solirubrobacter sp. CPCC 204708]|uniref:Uncharacterized protein n=1 Tax=Solirubrobacter deserti TaxID=2282478 RepID=A0ABT4RU99_9ACTN|nr:hypothetical protein [Solirubrobacter deserti]MBE2316450.1 hypothetical protein [Solirubrobacter deserti]MDA0142140.1 hypothetical protein [Solirubrobacter deserti]